uniref:TGRM2 protein n=1 Tax=Globodera pallida TaxID=36090 RepID=A0A183C8Q6_GLOPA
CASEAPFENSILERAIHSLIKCLKEDTELPVRVQSAVAIQSLINAHSQKGTVLQIVRPHIGDLFRNVLNLIKMTRVEDLLAVVDTLVEKFDEDVIPIAHDV